MSAQPDPAPRRRLVAVDQDSGEVVSREVQMLHERIASLEAALKEAEIDLRTKRGQITKLKKDLVQERFAYKRAADVRRVHAYWQRRLGHTQALTSDRFDAVRGILDQTRLELDAEEGRAKKVPAFRFPEDFKAAIDGAHLDPFITKRANGTLNRHDDLATICKDAKTFQSFIDRAPIRAGA